MAPQRTVHVASFSKTLAPGLRMGWVAGPAAIVDVLAQMRTDLGTSRLVQRMVARLITDGDFDQHLSHVRRCYRQKRDVVLDTLTATCSAHGNWNVPIGGFFVWFVLDHVGIGAVETVAADNGVGFFAAPYFSAGDAEVQGIRLAYGELAPEQLRRGRPPASPARSPRHRENATDEYWSLQRVWSTGERTANNRGSRRLTARDGRCGAGRSLHHARRSGGVRRSGQDRWRGRHSRTSGAVFSQHRTTLGEGRRNVGRSRRAHMFPDRPRSTRDLSRAAGRTLSRGPADDPTASRSSHCRASYRDQGH